MPIYTYQCLKTGERFERFSYTPIKLNELSIIPCELHTTFNSNSEEQNFHEAQKVWSLTSTIQIGKPTIVFKNPQTGDAIVAVHQHQQPPYGYVKEEIKGSIDRSKFEREQNLIHSQQDDIYNINQELARDEARKMRHDQIRADLSDVAATSENPVATEALMKAVLNRPIKPLKKRKTEFKLDVNHIDKSNL